MLEFEVKENSTVTYPETNFIDENNYVTIEDNFYVLTDFRGSKRFIPRQAEINAEVVSFKCQKPNNILYLVCIEKCS